VSGSSEPEQREVEVVIRAGGGVVRRREPDGPRVALVHRPRYDDWTLPKGKADRGEADDASALREVHEETGLRCELGPEVASVRYRDHYDRPKVVRYWLMYPSEGAFVPNDEVDRLRWVRPEEAVMLLTYGHDRDVIRRATAFDRPLYLVRHAKAGDRERWTDDDTLRPLTSKGRLQAEGLVTVFLDRAVDRVLSSPSVRCVQTLRPLALARRLPVEETDLLAEGARLGAAMGLLRGLAGAVVLCGHGDLIPAVVEHLAERGMTMNDTPVWKKGSVWSLERDGGLFTVARYVSAPD
jgi:8-oxo-dGTP pyrophosphatase MutT (NUDIX family)/phosphohistidine phosphatase SixA